MSRLHRQRQVAKLLHRAGFIGREFGDFFRHERNGHWTKAQLNLGKVELWAGVGAHSEWLGAIKWDARGKVHTDLPQVGHPLVSDILLAVSKPVEVPKHTPRVITMNLTAAMRDGQWVGIGPDVQIPLKIRGLEHGERYRVRIHGGVGLEVVK